MSKKKILIIGAGWEQAPLIEKAKELGLEVIAAHSDQTGEGLALADFQEIVEPRDLSKILEIAKKHQVEAVTADECDYSFFASVFAANCLGLAGASLDNVQLVSNKKRMRQKCKEAGILQPEFYPCFSLSQARSAAAQIGFPVILKPLDNRGNFGVNKVEKEEQLDSAFYEAIAHCHCREALVEKFIEGMMLMIDGFAFDDSGHFCLAVSSKKLLEGRKRVAMDIIYPAQIDKPLIEKAIDFTNKVVKALGIDRGATHTELMLTKEGQLYLLETHNRGGGVHISNKIAPALSGVDVCQCLLKQALGEKVLAPSKAIDIFQKFALLKFFRFPPGKVKQIKCCEEAEKIAGLLAFRLFIKPGAFIEEITADANRHGFTITFGQSLEEVYKISDKALSRVKIDYD